MVGAMGALSAVAAMVDKREARLVVAEAAAMPVAGQQEELPEERARVAEAKATVTQVVVAWVAAFEKEKWVASKEVERLVGAM